MTVKDHSSTDDQALVRAAQRGDMAAFEELVARHRDKIYARAYSMMRNEEEAVDLSQEAWVKGGSGCASSRASRASARG